MDEKKWAQEVSEQIKQKMRVVAERNRHKIPYTTTKDGVFDDCSDEKIVWWTNGFWGGLMWQMYHATKDEMYREIAVENVEKLDKTFMIASGMSHDSGFRWVPTAVADYRLTGNKESRNRGILAACDMAGRFNPVGRFIRAWNDNGDGSKAGWAIIDCMMNLPLLYWAYEELNDPRFLQVATMHADTAQKYFIREDGSAKHIVEFNTTTGEYMDSFGGQGYAKGSSWTRGQAWALYGFALSYCHTHNESYLNTAKRVANYFITNTPENGFIPVDFRQPVDCTLEDSTAAAIAACGMLEIARQLEKQGELEQTESRIYRNAAVKLLKALYENRCNMGTDKDNILEKCTAAFHDEEHEFAIIYGDYYFVEAIFKLTGEEFFIW